MTKINVFVVANIGKAGLQQIADVGPEIEVMDGSRLWVSPDPFIPDRKEDSRNPEFNALLARAEVIYGLRFPENLMARAPKLKWVQLRGTGVPRGLADDIVHSRVVVTNIGTVRAIPVAEWTFGLIMMLAKKAPFLLRNQQEKRWQRFSHPLLHSKTLGIVGLGRIGKEVARFGRAFNMKVIATRRSAPGKTWPKYIDRMLQKELLQELLAESDFVVLALPATSETDRLIGETEFRAMKPSAYLINVGRGSAVDNDTLVRALSEHWIAGAALDAHAVEPVPPGSRLWELPNLIVSPHVGGENENADERTTEFFCENLRRYICGKKLHDIVNNRRGY